MYTSHRPPTPYCGPSALLEETSSIKCPICTDQGFSIVTLECGHLIPTPDPLRIPCEPEDEFKKPPRTPCGRLCRRRAPGRQFTPPPEVVVHRLELAQRKAPVATTSKPTHPRPKKKKETVQEPATPDPRENGRILGSKVLPLMALLLQKNASEDDEEEANEESQYTNVNTPEKCKEDNGRRKLTIQCVQLLPDAEAMPAKPKSRRQCRAGR